MGKRIYVRPAGIKGLGQGYHVPEPKQTKALTTEADYLVVNAGDKGMIVSLKVTREEILRRAGY